MTEGPAFTARVSVRRRTAYALAIFPLDVVHRRTVRAMLPIGATNRFSSSAMRRRADEGKKHNSNKVSTDFQDALRQFAADGWIDRGREFIRVRDRGSLLDYALRDLTKVPEHFCHLERAVMIIRADLDDHNADVASVAAQRRRELVALMELMRSGTHGVRWSGRGSVEIVNKGKVL